MRPFANLHLHSTHSDGKYTPEELVLLAKEEGYGAIALTDHDTITGNADIAHYAKLHGMESIFGCEFSVQGQGKDDFHFVAFDFDPAYPPMAEYLKGMAYRQTHQTKAYFDLGVQKGVFKDITWEEVLAYNEGVEWFCNEQLFRALVKKGLYTREDYEHWADTAWYPLYKELHVPPAFPFLGPKEIIALVHAAGGIILIAHPHGVLDQIDRLVSYGLDGLEVYHPDLTPEEQVEALRIAYEKNLFIAGGTDHSGALGGEYISFKNPEECKYYLEPRVFGTMKEHFDELKTRKIGKREYQYTHTARRGKYL